jgi:hypothetical protein
MKRLPQEKPLGKGHEYGARWRARHGVVTGKVAEGGRPSVVVDDDEAGHRPRTVSVPGAPAWQVWGSQRLAGEWDHEGNARGSAKCAGGMTTASRIFDQSRVSRPEPP